MKKFLLFLLLISTPAYAGGYHVVPSVGYGLDQVGVGASKDVTIICGGGQNALVQTSAGVWACGTASSSGGSFTITSGQNVTLTSNVGVITIAANTPPTMALLNGVSHNDTIAGSPARGAIIAGNLNSKWGVVPLGVSGKYLRSNGTDVSFDTLNVSDAPTGILQVSVGGTGVTTTPGQGEFLIGTGGGYRIGSLVSGSNITITNTASAVTVSASSAAATGYQTIQNAGSSVTQRATLNLAGSFISAVDNAGSTRTDIIDKSTPVIIGGQFIGASATRYSAPYGSVIDATAANVNFVKVPFPCTARNLNFAFATAAGVNKQQRGTLWKNAVSTNLSCVAADPTTSCINVSANVAFVSNDTVSFEAERGGAATAPGNMGWTVECDGNA